MMSKTLFLVAIAVVALSEVNAQCSDEGNMDFYESSISHKTNCPQLSKRDCLFVHEAIESCPCVCEKRKNGEDPDGVGNYGDGKGDGSSGSSSSDSGSRSGTGCFHGDETVRTSEGVMKMSHLATIDHEIELEAFDHATQKVVMSPISYWMHRVADTPAKYVVVETESTTLRLTETHIMHISRECDGAIEAVMSKDVHKGDCVTVVVDGGNAFTAPITSITTEMKNGIYSPVTEQGTIVVSNTAASCFVIEEREGIMSWTRSVSDSMLGVFGGEARTHGGPPLIWQAMDILQMAFVKKM